jgi:molybdopterin-containing oxidoreductase family iron-sulfur binding subunit
MVVDIKKCRSPQVQQACIKACRQAHNLPDISDPAREVKWIWTEPFHEAFPDEDHAHLAPEIRDQSVLVMCNHCTKPACTKVCPTRATWRRDDGIVMMDMHRCIGCRYCMAACPFGARSFNWEDPPAPAGGKLTSDFPRRSKGVVEKCNFCAERYPFDKQLPACVEAAAKLAAGQGALTFGNLADRNSPVSRILETQNTICRRPNLGTGPNVYYLL